MPNVVLLLRQVTAKLFCVQTLLFMLSLCVIVSFLFRVMHDRCGFPVYLKVLFSFKLLCNLHDVCCSATVTVHVACVYVCVCFVLRKCYVVNETLKSKSFCVIFVCLSPSGFMHLSHSFSESPCLLVSFSLSDMGRWPSSINHLCIHSFCLSLSCVNTSVRC